MQREIENGAMDNEPKHLTEFSSDKGPLGHGDRRYDPIAMLPDPGRCWDHDLFPWRGGHNEDSCGGFRGKLYPLALCFVLTFPDDEIEKDKIDHSGEDQGGKHDWIIRPFKDYPHDHRPHTSSQIH